MPSSSTSTARPLPPPAARPTPRGPRAGAPAPRAGAPRRLATNFAALSAAEVACRATSVAVTLALAHRLGAAGYGRVEFAFNVVCWLVLLVREGFDVIAAREIARHPRLVRPLVNHVLALRLLVACVLLAGLVVVGSTCLRGPSERRVLSLYGLMLLTTALGLDYVYRGMERMGLVAVSLFTRTAVYAAGVLLWVGDASRIAWVPVLLAAGEACGIALVWTCYARRFGLPRPALRGGRFLRVFLRRGRSVYLIQVSQAVLGTVDLLVVGLLSRWGDVGRYSAPHRMVTAVLTFGLIFQQVVFPSLSRSWREAPAAGRRSMDALVRVLMLGLVPVAVGTTAMAGPLVAALLHAEYRGAGLLLALQVWRAPLLTLAFLYQTSLIALNRESAGVRLLLAGAIVAVPLVATARAAFGLPGAAAASIATGLGLAAAGYLRLAREGRQPAWHHHLARPALAAGAMVPACLALARLNVAFAVVAGAAVYFAALAALGGLRRRDVRTILGR